MPRPTSHTARPSALSLLPAGDPLAIDPQALARMQADPSAFLMGGEDEHEDRGYELADGVATICVDGVLMQRDCGWWAMGYDAIAKAFQAALDDQQCCTVVLRIDSPGGVVAGLFDTVRQMRAAATAARKRVVAVSDESCYSAAYALACVADEIVLPETGGVGSVGVVARLVSFADAERAEGIDVRLVTSGAEKADGNPHQPISDAAVSRLQATVDEFAGIFARWVAERRGMSVDAVMALQAGIRTGRAAVSAGLADRMAPVADVLAGLRTTSTTAPLVAHSTRELSTMDAIKALVGLAADATDADLLGRITALANAERESAVLRDAQAARITTLEGEVTTMRSERDAEKRAALLSAARADGRLSAGIEESDDWKALASTATTESLARLLAVMPRQTAAAPPVVPAVESEEHAPVAEMTDEDRHYARQAGLSDEQYLAARAVKPVVRSRSSHADDEQD